jgi:hypothetical protein
MWMRFGEIGLGSCSGTEVLVSSIAIVTRAVE